MEREIFSKRFISGIIGFMIGFFVFIPLHFWMLSRHTGDIERGITENQAMIEKLKVEQLTTLKLILSEYREEIKRIEEFNEYANQTK